MKLHLKRGDEVVVLNGSQSGKRGKVLDVNRVTSRALVEGVNLIKKAVRPTKENEKGGIIEREGPLHTSKLMLVSKFEARRARRGATA